MSAERTGTRVYDGIKAQILAGKLALRERIDIEALARAHRVSATPVREALNHLAAERLVSASGARGYFVTLWTERELKALYEWRAMLALSAFETSRVSTDLAANARILPYAQAVSAVLQGLEEKANDELKRAAINADERLQLARLVEEDVFGGALDELANLAQALNSRSQRARHLIKAFHRRRSERADIIRKRAVLAALPNGK